MVDAFQEAQRSGFEQAIRDGRYDAAFEHGDKAQRFFSARINEWLAARAGSDGPLRVLEAGCGTGAWLVHLHRLAGARPLTLCGFDLTDGMVALARDNVKQRGVPVSLETGDLLQADSYRCAQLNGAFDLIYAYDVVQQLPRPLQWRAVEQMAGQLAVGGTLMVFDHERWSRYGVRMAWRKFLTRWGPIQFVPKFYCNARYPALKAMARRLRSAGYRVSLERQAGFAKIALLVQH